MTASDLYMRYTDSDGNSHVMEHRVWDAKLFEAARKDDYARLGGIAEVITRHEYRLTR